MKVYTYTYHKESIDHLSIPYKNGESTGVPL